MSAEELRRTLEARMEFYRELGVYDFYRRAGAVLEEDTETITNRADCPTLEIETAEYKIETDTNTRVGPESRTSGTVLPALTALPPRALPDKPAALALIREEIGDCTRCTLALGRNKIVFADGDPNARLMFVGEGPGADEDARGLPFVGRAGQLLNNMITAMGLRREQVYIANIVKCRPPGNRVPEPGEAHTCMQFLTRQIDVVRPEVVVALGSTAATYLLGLKSALTGLRGRVHHCRGAKLIVTYHPAFLLRDPRQKKEAWKDLQMAMAELGLDQPARPPQA